MMLLMQSVLDEPAQGISHELSPAPKPPIGVLRLFSQRSYRVVVLVLLIAAMSGADLYLTLLYVTNTGMNEMNPLARAMMEYQSPMVLAIWKLATVVLSAGILLTIRKQRSAEIGAWAGCLVLGWLMTHWVVFVEQTDHMDIEVARAVGEHDPTWIMIHSRTESASMPARTVID